MPRPTLTFSNSPNQELFADPLDQGLAQRRASASGADRRGPKCKEECADEGMPCWRPPARSDLSRTLALWLYSPLPGLGRYGRLSTHHEGRLVQALALPNDFATLYPVCRA
jgi:hypothetical protein